MPKSQPLSLRLDAALLESLRREARRTARPASQIAQITLDEGLRMRKCPGILFTDGPAGRRASIAGTGIDVWEVVRVFKSCRENPQELASAMPQLSRPQLEAALHYYRRYAREVDERLRLEEEAAIELENGAFIRLVEV
jgi:uncharacterized protein (DUF433 family)